jgi:hypothetical protein
MAEFFASCDTLWSLVNGNSVRNLRLHEHLHYVAGDDCASFLLAGLPAAVRGFQVEVNQ